MQYRLNPWYISFFYCYYNELIYKFYYLVLKSILRPFFVLFVFVLLFILFFSFLDNSRANYYYPDILFLVKKMEVVRYGKKID